MANLRDIVLLAVFLFSLLSLFFLLQHELHATQHGIDASVANTHTHADSPFSDKIKKLRAAANGGSSSSSSSSNDKNKARVHSKSPAHGDELEKRGILMCDGKKVDSEVIYWKIVPGDANYESPITPHHGIHHDRYLSFEYDHGGWNNMRMGIECLAVLAHATGRTLVIPPHQHLYLLGRTHKDAHDAVAHDEMGFEDIYDFDLLKSHSGFHVMRMKEFLAKEAITGGLHGKMPPGNTSEAWGRELWKYLDEVGDIKPAWNGIFIFPRNAGVDLKDTSKFDEETQVRLSRLSSNRPRMYYDSTLQAAHHIHVPGDNEHRLITHHYSFLFFEDPYMQSFYKRFVRDYMRYNDRIQCAGARLVAAIRADAMINNNYKNDDYYSLHVRRGDFQFKDVKLSAAEIVRNLHDPATNASIIPRGALVYVSTDDPNGVCLDCLVQRKPCSTYPAGSKPVGCPEDCSWNAFIEAGWRLRFLHNYTSIMESVNPNSFGMVEIVACSRAKRFAGTLFSTFTGYIHRLRGYHGIGEETYYHSNGKLMMVRSAESIGHQFTREWRAGWVDDESGELI